MKVVTIFFALLVLGVVHAADKAPKRYPLPGIENLGRGFNAVSGQYRLPLFKQEFSQGNRWYNPHKEQQYSVPDNVYVSASSQVNVDVQVYGSFEAYLAAAASAAGVVQFQQGSLVEHRGAVQWGAVLAAEDAVLALVTEQVGVYEAIVVDASSSDETEFGRRVQELSEDCNEEQYLNLIEQYGTHVTVEALFGGEVQVGVAYDERAVLADGGAAVAASAAAKYNGLVGGQGEEGAAESASAAAEFELFYSVSAKGGLWEGIEQRENYTQSVTGAPAVIRQRLRPLHHFVEHPLHKKHLANALEKYTNTAAEKFQEKMSSKATASRAFSILHI